MDTLIDIIKTIVNKAIDQEIQPTDINQLHEVFECMKDLRVRYQHQPKKPKYFGGAVHVATGTDEKHMNLVDSSTETNDNINNIINNLPLDNYFTITHDRNDTILSNDLRNLFQPHQRREIYKYLLSKGCKYDNHLGLNRSHRGFIGIKLI